MLELELMQRNAINTTYSVQLVTAEILAGPSSLRMQTIKLVVWKTRADGVEVLQWV